MTIFLIVAILLIATALAFILPPLFGKGLVRPDLLSRNDANIAILRTQLSELDADIAAGTLGQEQYDIARNELQKRLLEDVTEAAAASAGTPPPTRTLAIVLGLAVPLLAAAFYFGLGNREALVPGATDNTPQEMTHELTPEKIEGMIAKLAKHLADNPNDAEGWAMMAQTYSAMSRYSESANAYGKLAQLVPDNPQILSDWADVLAAAQGNRFDGEPEKLIAKALAIDPDHPKTLALAGNVAFDHKDYAGALKYWQHMMTLVKPDSMLAKALAPDIAQAQALLGVTPVANESKSAESSASSIAAAVVSGRIEFDPALRSQVSDDDIVFIFVRAAEGPRMPLAALRKQVRDLPLDFSFDDAASLSADRKLSSVPKLIIGARISKSGNPIAQPGDIEVLSATSAPGAKSVRLRLTARNPH